ncbi:MAG: 5-formyltetrahydrofolate cyclo-ligase [Magnetococcus sp. MYC-9]
MEADKQHMRDTLRSMRRALSSAEQQGLSGAVCQRALQLPLFQSASSIGLYLSIDHEVDPSSLLHAATLSNKAVFLPVVDRSRRQVHFVRYRAKDPLRTGAFGLREPLLPAGQIPSMEETAACVSSMDILFLPLVAFDAKGWRLGYGGGYYDRLLSCIPKETGQKPQLIGLAYHFQAVPAVPHEAHDVPMDQVVTDRACLICPGAGNRETTHR